MMAGSLNKGTQTVDFISLEHTIHDVRYGDTEKSTFKEMLKDAGWIALSTAGASAAILGGIAIAVPALGFGAAGITAGSMAAAYQSAYLGGAIASGSVFATLQSVGAAGLAVATKMGVVAGSAGISTCYRAAKKSGRKSKGNNFKEEKNNDCFEDNETGKMTMQKYQKDVSTQT